MTKLEINNMGETIKIDVTETTTINDVIRILNDVWPGCAHLAGGLNNSIKETLFKNQLKAEDRERKANRIAQNAEAAQRLAKRGSWK